MAQQGTMEAKEQDRKEPSMSRLSIPHHFNSSVSSGSFSLRKGRSGSSVLRLSKNSGVNTNVESEYPVTTSDEQSLKTADRISSVVPSATYLDKLWSQIDVLDDVKAMSNQIREDGSFFNEDFNEELMKLKRLQNKLLETLANQLFSDKEVDEQEQLSISSLSSKTIDEAKEDLDKEARSRNAKINSFFDQNSKDTTTIEHNKQKLNELKLYVEEVRENLKAVATSMKSFDQTTKDLW